MKKYTQNNLNIQSVQKIGFPQNLQESLFYRHFYI